MKKYGLLLAGAAAIIAVPAQARDGEAYIGINGGVSFKDKVTVDASPTGRDEDFVRAATARTKMGLDADVVVGYDFGGFRLEAEGGYKNNGYRNLRVDNAAILPVGVVAPVGTVVDNQRDLEIYSGMVNAMVDIGNDDGFQVFGGGGVGVARLHLPVEVAGIGSVIDDGATEFAWQLIGGFRFPVNDRIDLGVKYRYFNIDDFRLQATNGNDLRANYSAHSVLASLTMNLGGRSEPAPVVAPAPAPVYTPPPPPPPVAAPPPPPQVQCNTGPYIVFFDFDRSDISPEASNILNNAVTAYANCGNARVMLAGHTDAAGSAQYNQGLAQRRNEAVRTYLNGRGIPSGQISAQAFGETQPRVPTADGVREAQNRRVEVTYGPGSGM